MVGGKLQRYYVEGNLLGLGGIGYKGRCNTNTKREGVVGARIKV